MSNWFSPLQRVTLAAAAALFSSAAHADFLVMQDGNVVEVDVVGVIQKPGARGGKPVDFYDCRDEKGETRQFRVSDVANAMKYKSSWRVREENQKWYEANGSKTPKNWQAQSDMGKQCRKKGLEVEALLHFREAFALRQEVPLAKDETNELRLRHLAEWLEKDCGMFDEAINEYQKVYDEIKEKHKTPAERVKLATWCTQHDLEKQAEEQFKQALADAPADRIVKAEFEKFRRAQAVPLHQEMYRGLKLNMEAACKFLRTKQKPDGSFGSDATEASVQAWRGMTAVTAEALMCEWDLKYFVDPEGAAKPPKEVTKALDFLLTGKKSDDRRFMGRDLWGPTFSLNFLVRCLSRPYLQDRKYEISDRIVKEIALLKELQLPDGGWYYYNFHPVGGSFVTAGILANMIVAKNYGFEVDGEMLSRARELLRKCKFGRGTYTYSADGGREGGKDTSYSPVGASARSPLCDWAMMAAGEGNQDSLTEAIKNFYMYQPILSDLRGSDRTHIGKSRTAPYYYMYGHLWTARALKQMPRALYSGAASRMLVFVMTSQNKDGTFHDWTGTKDYQVYATALGVMTMFQLMSAEQDPAFLTAGQAKEVADKLNLKAHKPVAPITPVTIDSDNKDGKDKKDDKTAATPPAGKDDKKDPAKPDDKAAKKEPGANDFDDLAKDDKKPEPKNAGDTKKPDAPAGEKKPDEPKPADAKPEEKKPEPAKPEEKTEKAVDKPAEKPADKAEKPVEKTEKPAEKPADPKPKKVPIGGE